MKIKTITGRGFIKDSAGAIIAKTSFSPDREHELTAGYIYEEASDALLNAWIPEPKVLTRKEIVENLISKKQRDMAITQLLAEGKITAIEANETA